jgi:hypothetical protein
MSARFAFIDVTTGWRTPAARAGAQSADHQLRCAYAIASLRRAGASARPIVRRRLDGLAGLTRDVLRCGAELAVLWAPAPYPPAVPALARMLRAAGLRVLAAGDLADWPAPAGVETGLGAEPEAAVLALAAGADAGSAASLPPPDLAELPSPWLERALPASAAGRAGIELERPPLDGEGPRRHETGRVLAELAWIDRHAVTELTAPLHGDLLGAPALLDALAGSPPRRVALAARVGIDAEPDPDALAAFAAARGRVLTIVLDSAGEPDGAADSVRAWQDAAPGLDVQVAGDLPADPADLPALEALLARVGREAPTLRYAWRPARPGAPPRRPARLAVPELSASPAFREEAALERSVLARVLRAYEGVYRDAAGYADGVAEVIWAHPDPPAQHADALAELLCATSLLAVLADAAPAPAPAPLTEAWRLVREPRGRLRLDGGDAIDVLPYREGATAAPDVPLVLAVDERADAELLLEHADAAHDTGEVPHALASPLTRIQDATLWTAPYADPTARLPRLWVGEDGALRPAPAAAPVGMLGEPFAALVERTAGRAEPACRPSWLEAPELARWHAARPWLPAFAAGPALRRRLAETLGPGAGDVRIAGLGGRLAYDGPGGAARSGRRVLVRAGGAHVLYDPAGGGLARVTQDVAAVWEGLACAGDPAVVAAWLQERRGVDAARARATVTQVAGRLGS